jgi:hypothetical protein
LVPRPCYCGDGGPVSGAGVGPGGRGRGGGEVGVGGGGGGWGASGWRVGKKAISEQGIGR